MTAADRCGGYTPGRATRFYVPLFLQAFSQSLTYPLVGAIASRGTFGVDELTAFTQGQIAMFFIGAIGGGLITTGMVFARSQGGYSAFKKLNAWMMLALVGIQVLCALGPLGAWIFGTLFKLPAHLAEIAQRTMLLGAVMQSAFFVRNVPLVVLFNARASAEANWATVARIGLTFACSLAFPHLKLTGAYWALAALTALEEVDLSGAKEPVSVAFAAKLPALKTLDLSGATVTDGAVVASLPKSVRVRTNQKTQGVPVSAP